MTLSDQQAAARAAFLARRRTVPPPAPIGGYRVLHMKDAAEEAVLRFMDDAWEAGHRAHGPWRPSRLLVMAWCMIGTAHVPLMSAVAPSETPDTLEPPCSGLEILAYAGRPALSREEAEHRADRFCARAVDLARERYRDGFYADPFTRDPIPRPMGDHPTEDNPHV